MNSLVILVGLTTVVVVAVHASPLSQRAQSVHDATLTESQSNVRAKRGEDMDLIRELISELSARVEQRKQKRTCLFNAGMGNSCDYGAIASAGDEHRYLMGGASPCRRKNPHDRLVGSDGSSPIWTDILKDSRHTYQHTSVYCHQLFIVSIRINYAYLFTSHRSKEIFVSFLEYSNLFIITAC